MSPLRNTIKEPKSIRSQKEKAFTEVTKLMSHRKPQMSSTKPSLYVLTKSLRTILFSRSNSRTLRDGQLQKKDALVNAPLYHSRTNSWRLKPSIRLRAHLNHKMLLRHQRFKRVFCLSLPRHKQILVNQPSRTTSWSRIDLIEYFLLNSLLNSPSCF